MDFLCSGPVKKIFTHWIGTVFNLNFTIDEKDQTRTEHHLLQKKH